MTRRRWSARTLLVGTALAAIACTPGTDHERLGDRRYAERAWADALAEYRLAARQRRPSTELRAKFAAAALHAGALEDAANAYRDLARADAASKPEAVEGLVRTIRAAVEVRDVVALRSAAGAIRELAPERLIPSLGRGLAVLLETGSRGGDAELLLAAAAQAGGASVDSLVGSWAAVVAQSGRCDVAARAYEGMLRRNPPEPVQRLARGGLAGCELEAGRLALAAGELEEAVTRFEAAIGFATPDSTVRLAWVLLGDARWADGDTATAAEAYRKAIAGGSEESPTVQRAQEQLQRLSGGNPNQP